MGEIAREVLRCGGQVTGVIPEFMVKQGWCNTALTEVIVTADMHERKRTMAALADTALAMPGGCGTFEELLEIITWRQLGLFTKPILILNTMGYYNPLLKMFETAIGNNFMRSQHAKMWQAIDTPADIFAALADRTRWEQQFQKFAAI